MRYLEIYIAPHYSTAQLLSMELKEIEVGQQYDDVIITNIRVWCCIEQK